MAVEPGGPQQFGQTHFNMWAMLRGLVFNSVGILAFSGTPVSGASGSFVNKAGPGTLVIDITTGAIYTNVGTITVPVWSSIAGPNAGLAGTGNVGTAKVTYDFTVDGGAIGPIIPASSPILPANAIILGGALDITTALTSSGAATIALGTSAGSSASSLKAATAVASWTVGLTLPIIPIFTAATYLKLTAAGRPNLTVAAFALLSGKFDLNLVYVIGNS